MNGRHNIQNDAKTPDSLDLQQRRADLASALGQEDSSQAEVWEGKKSINGTSSQKGAYYRYYMKKEHSDGNTYEINKIY